MIEVMFGESEGGAMRAAKNYRKPDYRNGATAWFGKKPSKEEFDKMFGGEPVGGDASQVVCLPFLLDMGDISVPVESEYRKNFILNMYTTNQRDDTELSAEYDAAWNRYINEIARLRQFAKQGESIRLWYSDAPYSLCGFYHACSILEKYNCKVSVVKLPSHIRLSDTTLQFFISWGEVEAGKFHQFLDLEKELNVCERKTFASRWLELKEENAPLRAMINGTLIGVNEDFYDFVIRKELPEGEIVMARLIGNILGKYHFGVGDWWYANRINRMITLGEIEVVEEREELYRRILKRK